MFTQRIWLLAKLTLAVTLVQPASGVDVDWRVNSNGVWESSSNWTPGVVPDGSYSVFIGRSPNPQGHRVDLDTDRTIDALSVLNASGLSINENSFRDPDGELSTRSASVDGVGSEIEVFANIENGRLESSLTLFGTGGLDLTNQATLRMAGGRVDLTNANAMIDNRGIRNLASGGVHGHGTINMNASTTSTVFSNEGRLRAFGGTLRLNAATGKIDLDGTSGNGQVDVASNSTLVLNGSLSDPFDGDIGLLGGSTIDFTQGWVMENASLNVAAASGLGTIRGGIMQAGAAGGSATINVQSGTAKFENELDFFNGTFNIAATSTLEFAGLTTIRQADALNRSAGSVLRVSGDTTIVDAGGTATFDLDGASGDLLTEVVGNGRLMINVDYLDILLQNDFNGQINLADNGGLDVLTADNSWTLGNGGRIAKTGSGVSVIGASGSPLTTSGSGQLAVESGTLDVQIPLSMPGGNLQVAAGGVAELNNLATFGVGSQLTVDGVLRWNLPVTFDGTTNVTGSGRIVNEGNMTVAENSRLSVATFDWDQGTTLVQPGKTLTLDVDRIDTSNDDFNNNTVTVDSGILNVSVADGEWRLANGGILHLTSNALPTPTLQGDRLFVTGTGEVRVSNGTAGDADADIEAPLTLNEGTQLLVQDSGNVRLLGATTLAGGDINSSASGVVVSQNGPLTVTGPSEINVATYDWDQNSLTTVETNGDLSINVTQIDVADQTFDSNLTIRGGGQVDIELANNEWTLNGTLRIEPQPSLFPKVFGDRIRIGNAATADEFGSIVVEGSGFANVVAPITIDSHSQISVGSGTTLDLSGATDLNGNASGSIAGAGRLRLLNTVRVNADSRLETSEVNFTPFVDVQFMDTSVFVSDKASISQGATFAGSGKLVGGMASTIEIHNLANAETTIESSGHIQLGSDFDPTATVSIDDLRMTADTSSIAFDLVGPQGNSNDQVFVANQARLDGTLTVSLLDSFEPTLGTTFRLVRALGGFEPGGDQFDSANLPSLNGGLAFDLSYTATEVNLEVISVALSGDFNGDGQFDCTDIDGLVSVIAAGTNSSSYDMTADGLVDIADRDAWLTAAGAHNLASGNSFLLGDADLNGAVDGADFAVWSQNKFTHTAAWCSGDFNANGQVDGRDFLLWNANKFTSSGAAAVPEPSGCCLMMLLGLGFFMARSTSNS